MSHLFKIMLLSFSLLLIVLFPVYADEQRNNVSKETLLILKFDQAVKKQSWQEIIHFFSDPDNIMLAKGIVDHNNDKDNKIVALLDKGITINHETWSLFPTIFTLELNSTEFETMFTKHYNDIVKLQKVSQFFCKQTHKNDGDFCKVDQLLINALSLFEGLPSAKECIELASDLENQGKTIEAQQKMQSCMRVFEDANAEQYGVPIKGLQAFSKGEVALQKGECQKALTQFEAALNAYQATFKSKHDFLKSLNQQTTVNAIYSEAKILRRQAVAYTCLGDYINAKQKAELALKITQTHDAQYQGALVSSTLCQIHTLLSECSEAINACQSGIGKIKQLMRTDGKRSAIDQAFNPGQTMLQSVETELSRRLGQVQQQCSTPPTTSQTKNEDAYTAFNKALTQAEGTGNKGQQAIILGQMCNHYMPYFFKQRGWTKRKDFSKIFEGNPEILEIIKQAHAGYSQQLPPEIAHIATELFSRNIHHIAWIEKVQKPMQEGIGFCDRALQLARENDNSLAEYEALLYKGRLYAFLGRANTLFALPRELSAFPKHLHSTLQPILEKFRQQSAETKQQMFNIDNLGNELIVAQHYLKASLSLQKKLKLPSEQQWQTHNELAQLSRFTGDLDQAVDYYQAAIENIESVHQTIDKPLSHESNPFYSTDRMLVYDDAIDALLERYQQHNNIDDAKQAWKFFEQKQGRRIVEDLARSGVRLKNAELSQRIIDLEKRTEALQAQREKYYLTPASQRDVDQLNSLQKEQIALNGIQQELDKAIKADATLQPVKPIKLAELQQHVLKTDEALLIYHAFDQPTHVSLQQPSLSTPDPTLGLLWVITKKSFEMHPLKGDFKLTKQQVICTYNTLSTGEMSSKCADPSKNLQQLYQTLLPNNLLSTLQDKTLYIVPDNIFYKLPFEALITNKENEKPNYLIQNNPIVYLSSASLLKVIRSNTSNRQQTHEYPLLTFANPDYAPISSNECTLQPLNQSQSEAEAVSKLMYDNKPKFLYSQERAIKDELQALNKSNKLSQFRYLLFSMHGVFHHPKKRKCGVKGSALTFANPYNEPKHQLDINDIYNLKLNSDLVMLSACDTGGVKQVTSDPVGLRGLTSAFLYAGSASVGVTLWKTEDTAIKKLTVGLFKELSKNDNKISLATAMQKTKIQLIEGKSKKTESYTSPHFWATSVLFGEGAYISPTQ